MKVINQKKSKLLFSETAENSILFVNLSNLADNWRQLNSKINNSELAVSIKANAYGLGYQKISKELVKVGCRTFFVASVNEALELRGLYKNVNIFLLSNAYSEKINIKLIKNNITIVINNKKDLKKINSLSKYFNKKIRCALQFDIGMNRLGFCANDIDYVSQFISKTLDVALIIGHLSCSENKNSYFNKQQLNNFIKIKKKLQSYKLSFSLSNSNAIYLGKKYHFDMCRAGGILYGLNLSKNLPDKIKTVSTLKSKILQLRFVAKGNSIGYGANYKVKCKSKIATIGLGYADGLPRNYKGYAFHKGNKFNFVGNISMDLSTLDVTSAQHIKENDWIEIFGDSLLVSKMSINANTISYEILSRLGKRVERIYIYNN